VIVATVTAGAVAALVATVLLAALWRWCDLLAGLGRWLSLLLTWRAGAFALLDELQRRGLRLGLLALLGCAVAQLQQLQLGLRLRLALHLAGRRSLLPLPLLLALRGGAITLPFPLLLRRLLLPLGLLLRVISLAFL
jgi:hypothetical protein